jgi:hypothetical protein
MSLARNLDLLTEFHHGTNYLTAPFPEVYRRNDLTAYNINRVWNKNQRNHLDEIVAFIETGVIDRLCLGVPPVDEKLGRRVSHAFASNPHITEIHFTPFHRHGPYPGRDATMRDVITWFSIGGETLVHMTNLQKIVLYGYDHASFMSDQDWDLIYPLLLTSTSLQELRVTPYRFGNGDRVMRALIRYLGAASIRNLDFSTGSSVSKAAFTSFCDVVAKSSLQKLTLEEKLVRTENVETAAESLARAISESSLEKVTIRSAYLRSALLRTTPVRDFDLAFSQGGLFKDCLKINRKWKPLVGANIPLGLWPHIFEKSYTSPQSTRSHSPEDIIFFFLREKPDLLKGMSSKLECSNAMSESPISKLS